MRRGVYVIPAIYGAAETEEDPEPDRKIYLVSELVSRPVKAEEEDDGGKI